MTEQAEADTDSTAPTTAATTGATTAATAGPAAEVLDREFLTMRSRVLDLAASLDRVDRAGSAADDPRWSKLRSAIEVLLAPTPGRAERVQLLFSLPYDEDWRERYGLVGEASSVN